MWPCTLCYEFGSLAWSTLPCLMVWTAGLPCWSHSSPSEQPLAGKMFLLPACFYPQLLTHFSLQSSACPCCSLMAISSPELSIVKLGPAMSSLRFRGAPSTAHSRAARSLPHVRSFLPASLCWGLLTFRLEAQQLLSTQDSLLMVIVLDIAPLQKGCLPVPQALSRQLSHADTWTRHIKLVSPREISMATLG